MDLDSLPKIVSGLGSSFLKTFIEYLWSTYSYEWNWMAKDLSNGLLQLWRRLMEQLFQVRVGEKAKISLEKK